MIKTYKELSGLLTFEERYSYLKLKGSVGRDTFGFDRYINQMLYRSKRWRDVRDQVIIRDEACDLGIPGYEILDKIIVHHMNPISLEEIENADDSIFDLEFLISTSHRTHQAIHYSDESLLPKVPISRFRGDTTLW